MEKLALSAIDMLKIAAQHAYCAEHLLKQNAEVLVDDQLSIDALLPISTLLYQAFELTLKAFLTHSHRQIKQYKTLFELIELNDKLGFSKQDLHLLSTLAREQGFRKGVDHALWINRQEQQVFCQQLLVLFEKIQDIIPLELRTDYQ